MFYYPIMISFRYTNNLFMPKSFIKGKLANSIEPDQMGTEISVINCNVVIAGRPGEPHI